MNQKEATVGTILAVLREREVKYELNGDVAVSEVLTDADKKSIRGELFDGFRNGDISYKDEFQHKVDDDAELKKYVSGLVNNWIRKNKEFNCGVVYVAKNPGSRAHVQDEQLRELKKLSALCGDDSEAMSEIADAILKRKAEIAVSKAKDVTINVEALPKHLRGLVKS